MIDLKPYGMDELTSALCRQGEIPGRVTAVFKGQFELVCKEGICGAKLKASCYYTGGNMALPVVGDLVCLQFNPQGFSLITRTLQRKSLFSRSDFSGHAAKYAKNVMEQSVAANFDYVFILTSMNNDFNEKRVERYLIQARNSGAQPVIVLTKADLCGDPSLYVEAVQRAADGVDVVCVSAVNGTGLDALRGYLKEGEIAVFLGSSGVGKSSLLNALAGSELMDTKAIREDDAKGRHTTTHRQLFLLEGGGMVIDTPGMRELGLFDTGDGLETAFADVAQLISRCRFSNCSHGKEPGCAVQAAIRAGELSKERWKDYKKLHDERCFVDRR